MDQLRQFEDEGGFEIPCSWSKRRSFSSSRDSSFFGPTPFNPYGKPLPGGAAPDAGAVDPRSTIAVHVLPDGLSEGFFKVGAAFAVSRGGRGDRLRGRLPAGADEAACQVVCAAAGFRPAIARFITRTKLVVDLSSDMVDDCICFR